MKDIFTNQQRQDLLCSAIEGGSNYWYMIPDDASRVIDEVCKDHNQPFVDRMWEAIKAGKSIDIVDVEGAQYPSQDYLGAITMDSIRKGEEIMREKYAWAYAEVMGENDDANTADIWFQLAVMGEVVYG